MGGRTTSRANAAPLPLLEGSKLKLVGPELGGSAPSLPSSTSTLSAPPAVPSFLSAIQTVHTAKQGAEGMGGRLCIEHGQRRVRETGGEAVLLTEVAPGLSTGFWESLGWELLLLLLVGPEGSVV